VLGSLISSGAMTEVGRTDTEAVRTSKRSSATHVRRACAQESHIATRCIRRADSRECEEVARKFGRCTKRETPPMVPVRAYKGVRRVRCRPKVEHYLVLDIRKLQRYGLLKPGTEGSVLLRSADGRQVATASFLIAPSKLRVQLAGVRRSVPTEICIERSACPFGGTRPWFRCRRCNSRRATLYGLDEDNSFSCRRCMGLVYRSQDETKLQRLYLNRTGLKRS